MKKDKVYELRIEEDDEISGIDSISLVSEPAIEINWIAFNKVQSEDFHIPDGEDEKYIQKLISTAQNEQELFDEGWVVDSVEILDGKNNFVSTNPNGPSIQDETEYNVRYKYILKPGIQTSPIINTTRDFCRELINKNFVWRIEDMEATQNDFGQSAMVWRGGYNCRHVWSRIKYRKDANIVNKASVNRGKVLENGFPNDIEPDTRVLGYTQPETVTNKTLANPSNQTITNLGLSKEKFELPLFPTKEEAEKLAPLLYGCTGSHEHIMDGKTYYMPCEKHPEDLGYDNVLPPFVDEGIEKKRKKKKEEQFQSYTDYPLAATENAKRALRWAEKNGWGDCGTPVGKIRANQLASRQSITEETIARMASFARHRQNKDVPYDKGCGGLMWDAWGGTEGIEWASRKLESIRSKQNMSFQTDEEKRIVIGPAMVPDLKIFRKDKNGDPYYVVFKKDTIKMIMEKYMRNKYIDNNDTEHNGKVAEDVYVIESWIKEDNEDKSNKYGFENLPIGTWFVSMKVRNEEVWKMVKEKKLNGFSVSGFFEEVEQFYKEQEFLKEVSKILKDL